MKVSFGLIRCSGNLIFVSSVTSKNRPSATFVAAEVPKSVWALHFCESSFPFVHANAGTDEIHSHEDSSLLASARILSGWSR